MDFLTSTILSGLVWDGIKYAGSVSTRYLKEKLTNWIVDDQEIEIITSKINEMPEAYKKNEKFLELAIEEDAQLMETLKKINSKNGTNVDISRSNFQNSTVNTLGSGSTVNNTTHYYSQNHSEFPMKIRSREDVKKELQLLLSENAAVFKMYGPTPENTLDLMTRKHEAWKSMALKIIVPNNDKIIKLLQDNIHLLNAEEQVVFFEYKLHAEGFKDNQVRIEKIADYPIFPSAINSILGD